MITPDLNLRSSVAALVSLIVLTACAEETLRPDRGSRSLADGVTPAESLAMMDQPGRTRVEMVSSTFDEACTLRWDIPDQMWFCSAPTPAVVPSEPWLQHNGEARNPGEIEQRAPIHISFVDQVHTVNLTSTGALKCTGTHGRMVGFRGGVQVVQVNNTLIDPADCGEDDVTYGVRGQLSAGVHIDSLIIEGVDPWTFTVDGMSGRALLKYTIDFQYVACDDTVRAIIEEYQTLQVNVPDGGGPMRPICADFAADGGSTNFLWPALNDNWRQGNPHRPWSMIRQALLDGLEATRTIYNRGEIRLSSGYRCPHGNASIPNAVPNSWHVHGQAADMFSRDHPWTEAEFTALRNAALNTVPPPEETSVWTEYPDHHLHAAWREGG